MIDCERLRAGRRRPPCRNRYWLWPEMTASGLLISWLAPAANSASAASFAACTRSAVRRRRGRSAVSPSSRSRRGRAVGRADSADQRAAGSAAGRSSRDDASQSSRSTSDRRTLAESRSRSADRSAEFDAARPPGRLVRQVRRGLGLLGEQRRDLHDRLEPRDRRRAARPRRGSRRGGPDSAQAQRGSGQRAGESPGDLGPRQAPGPRWAADRVGPVGWIVETTAAAAGSTAADGQPAREGQPGSRPGAVGSHRHRRYGAASSANRPRPPRVRSDRRQFRDVAPVDPGTSASASGRGSAQAGRPSSEPRSDGVGEREVDV